MAVLGFLHTAEAHVATFEALLHELAPGTATANVVEAGLLARARRHGPGAPEVAVGVGEALDGLEAAGAGVVLCTCSTIGGVAERLGRGRKATVLRVDRPMAERAVRRGRRVMVLGTVESTLAPTRELIESVAARAGRTVEVGDRVVEGAWARFEQGEVEESLSLVAAEIDGVAGDGGADVIVLAQASMAAAAARATPGVAVLSSPASGLRAALVALGDARRPA